MKIETWKKVELTKNYTISYIYYRGILLKCNNIKKVKGNIVDEKALL